MGNKEEAGADAKHGRLPLPPPSIFASFSLPLCLLQSHKCGTCGVDVEEEEEKVEGKKESRRESRRRQLCWLCKHSKPPPSTSTTTTTPTRTYVGLLTHLDRKSVDVPPHSTTSRTILPTYRRGSIQVSVRLPHAKVKRQGRDRDQT